MWPFKKRKSYIKIAGERIEVKPLSLPDTIELILLMAPYWPLIDEHSGQIERAIAAKNRALLSEIFFILREKMKETPGDITKAIALLAGVSPVWLASNATAQDIVTALPILDRVHNFKRLWEITQAGKVYLKEP